MANYTLNYTGEKVDELLNKIDTAFGEETVMGDTLTWDGNTEGLHNVMGMYYHVSDVVPTLEELQQGGTVKEVMKGVEQTTTFIAENVMDAEPAGMGTNLIILAATMPVLIATQDGATMVENGTTFTFEKAGIYFPAAMGSTYVASLAINNYTGFPTTGIKTIDPKYIPSTKTVFYSQSNSVGIANVGKNKLYKDAGFTQGVTQAELFDKVGDFIICVPDAGTVGDDVYYMPSIINSLSLGDTGTCGAVVIGVSSDDIYFVTAEYTG